MVRRPLASVAAVGVVCLVAGSRVGGAPSAVADAQAPINQIYLEVAALSSLYDLYATPEQMKALQGIAAETASKKGLESSPHPGRPYRSGLVALRDAYVKNDDDEIGDCQERVDNLEEKMDHPPDPQVEVTDAARRRAGEALKLFTPTQIAEYISARSDDAPDPAGILVDTLGAVPGQGEKEFAALRKQTVDELSELLAGADGAKRKSLGEEIGALIDRAHGMSAEDYKSRKGELEKEAHKLADPADPTAVLSNWVRRDMADLLSNPQLSAALAARLK